MMKTYDQRTDYSVRRYDLNKKEMQMNNNNIYYVNLSIKEWFKYKFKQFIKQIK